MSVKVPNVTDSIQKELSKEVTIPTLVQDKHLLCFAKNMNHKTMDDA